MIVQAERLPLGQLLQALQDVTGLDHVRIDPALRGRRVTVQLRGIPRADLAMEVLRASGIDLLAWGQQVVLGDPEKAVPFSEVGRWDEAPEPSVAEADLAVETSPVADARGGDEALADPRSDERASETVARETTPGSADDVSQPEATALTAWPVAVPAHVAALLGGETVTPEMRSAYAAMSPEEQQRTRAELLARPVEPPAPDPNAIRAEDAAAETYVTAEFSMVGESVTYSDPNFVPYKNRPEVRARRLSMDVSTIP